MSLQIYSNEIESLEFQIQFSVVGGIKILQMAMNRHPTLISLRSEVAESDEIADAVFGRIVLLLGRVDTETELSLDESIAAYLFCLLKEKPIAAYRASWRILDYGGLWWSVQLAHLVKETSREILDSMDTSDSDSKTVPFVSSDSTGLSDEGEISIAYTTKNHWDFALRSTDLVLRAKGRSLFTFSNKAWAGLQSKKKFEISDSSNRQEYVEFVLSLIHI